MAKRKIREQSPSKDIKETADNKNARTSTKIIIGFVIGGMLLLTKFSVEQAIGCKLSTCYLGGAGTGSLVVGIAWLIVDSIKN